MTWNGILGTEDSDNPHLITAGRDNEGAFIYPFLGEELYADEPVGKLVLAMFGSDFKRGGRRMSYDIWMEIDTGDKHLAGVSEGHNYTYNVFDMYKIAFDNEHGINVLHGMLGADAAPLLNKAMVYMSEHVDEMQALNPENGWGDADGALAFLRSIYEDTLRHPKAMVGVH